MLSPKLHQLPDTSLPHVALKAHAQDAAPWAVAARAKRAQQARLIPVEWLLPAGAVPIAGDLRDVVATCGVLTARQLEITDTVEAGALLKQLADRSVSAEEVCKAFCARAAVAHQLTNCLTEILFEPALARAKQLDEHLQRTGQLVGPLHGLPISLKDQFDIEGVDSTLGFVAKIGCPATANSVLVSLLLELGAIIHCKTNVPQSLMCEETTNNVFGRTINPRNPALTSGGSSGGEGALLALKGSICGFGTDFGGSIRKPSTYCGLYGLRPTSRRMPYAGVSNVLKGAEGIESVVGPMANSLATIELVMSAVIGAEPWKSDSHIVERPWVPSTMRRKLRVAIMETDGVVHNHPPVRRMLDDLKKGLVEQGHQVVPWAALDHAGAQQLFASIASADGGQDLKSFMASGEPYIPEAFPFTASSAISVYEYYGLVKKRDLYRQNFLRVCKELRGPDGEELDLILLPAAPHLAPPHLGAPRPSQLISNTTVWSLLDMPACVIPLSTIDPVIDMPYALDGAYSSFDQAHWDAYTPEKHANAPLTVQLVSPRRFREDELLGMASIIHKVYASG